MAKIKDGIAHFQMGQKEDRERLLVSENRRAGVTHADKLSNLRVRYNYVATGVASPL